MRETLHTVSGIAPMRSGGAGRSQTVSEELSVLRQALLVSG
jgi:hypothetical protein